MGYHYCFVQARYMKYRPMDDDTVLVSIAFDPNNDLKFYEMKYNKNENQINKKYNIPINPIVRPRTNNPFKTPISKYS